MGVPEAANSAYRADHAHRQPSPHVEPTHPAVKSGWVTAGNRLTDYHTPGCPWLIVYRVEPGRVAFICDSLEMFFREWWVPLGRTLEVPDHPGWLVEVEDVEPWFLAKGEQRYAAKCKLWYSPEA